MEEPSQGKYLDVGGIKTFYIEAGSGYPLLLFHGGSPGACSSVNWKPNIGPLAKAGFTVYAFDQAGFGYTGNPSDYSLDYRVVHARSFIHTLQLGRFHLIGNSMGAYIAARIALEEQGTGKLILLSSSTLAPRGSPQAQALGKQHSEELRQYTPSLENARAMTMKTFFKSELVTEELVEERHAMSSGPRFEAILRRREAPPAQSILEELPKLKAKTLILWGNNDRGAAVERALLLCQLLPNAELHIFNQCGHWVQWDQAERFNRIVADFLSDQT